MKARIECHAHGFAWACETPHAKPGAWHPRARRGAALIACVIILAVITLFMSLITFQIVRHRRYVDRREQQIQALWLARSGIERAAAQMLTSRVKSESFDALPLGKVRVEIKEDKDVIRIISEAKYPADLPDGVVREVARNFKRVEADGKVRLQVMPNN